MVLQVGPLVMHETVFQLEDSASFDTLLALVALVRHTKGAEATIDGQPIQRYVLSRTLECYRQSLHGDRRAHCWVRHGAGVFPCRLAAPYSTLSCHHPSSRRAQVEAILVSRGCAWCPALHLDEWELEYG